MTTTTTCGAWRGMPSRYWRARAARPDALARTAGAVTARPSAGRVGPYHWLLIPSPDRQPRRLDRAFCPDGASTPVRQFPVRPRPRQAKRRVHATDRLVQSVRVVGHRPSSRALVRTRRQGGEDVHPFAPGISRALAGAKRHLQLGEFVCRQGRGGTPRCRRPRRRWNTSRRAAPSGHGSVSTSRMSCSFRQASIRQASSASFSIRRRSSSQDRGDNTSGSSSLRSRSFS